MRTGEEFTWDSAQIISDVDAEVIAPLTWQVEKELLSIKLEAITGIKPANSHEGSVLAQQRAITLTKEELEQARDTLAAELPEKASIINTYYSVFVFPSLEDHEAPTAA